MSHENPLLFFFLNLSLSLPPPHSPTLPLCSPLLSSLPSLTLPLTLPNLLPLLIILGFSLGSSTCIFQAMRASPDYVVMFFSTKLPFR